LHQFPRKWRFCSLEHMGWKLCCIHKCFMWYSNFVHKLNTSACCESEQSLKAITPPSNKKCVILVILAFYFHTYGSNWKVFPKSDSSLKVLQLVAASHLRMWVFKWLYSSIWQLTDSLKSEITRIILQVWYRICQLHWH